MNLFERFVGHGWGSVDVEFDCSGYRLGDEVVGTVTVQAKRDLGPGTVRVAVVCDEQQSRTVPSGRRRLSHQRQRTELWRRELELDTAADLAGGTRSSYDYLLALPSTDTRPSPDEIPEWAAGTIAVIDALTFRQRQLIWELRARFSHDDGFDLRRSRRIHVTP